MPHRERYLFVCINRRPDDDAKGSCAVKGSEQIADDLKAAIAKLGAQKKIRACRSSCLDLCVAYGRVTREDVDEIARATVEGRIVERLVVAGKK
jgi:(2Fe-2S) ferredoxin